MLTTSRLVTLHPQPCERKLVSRYVCPSSTGEVEAAARPLRCGVAGGGWRLGPDGQAGQTPGYAKPR
jgi:hypothetical protein